jgi:hypothetical protein
MADFVAVGAVGNWIAGSTTTGTSPTKSTTTGNFLFVSLTHYTSGVSVTGVTDTAGNTYVKAGTTQGGDASHKNEIWYTPAKITGNAANAATMTTSGAASYRIICQAEFSHPSADSIAFDAEAAHALVASSSLAYTSNALSTTVADDLILANFVAFDGPVAFSNSTGTIIFESNPDDLALAYRFADAAASYSIALGVAANSTNRYSIVAKAFKAVSGGTAAQLAGAATGVATGSANLTSVDLFAGAASAVATATGPLTAQIRFAGAGSGVASALANLATPQLWPASALASALASGALTAQIRLAGAAISIAQAGADLSKAPKTFAGAATGVATASAPGGLAAFVTLAGAAGGAATALGDMRPAVDLSWAAPAGWTPSGYRVKWGSTSGNYTSTKDVAAGVLETTLWGLQPGQIFYWIVVGLNGTGVEQTPSAEATFNTFPAKSFAGAAIGNATAAAAFSSLAILGGAAAGQAGATGNLYKPIPLAGAALGVTTAGAAVTTQIRLSASAIAQAIAQGNLGVPGASMEGAAASAAIASGALTITAAFAVQAFASATGLGDLTVGAQLGGAASGEAIASGMMSVPVTFSAAALGQALAAGYLTLDVRFEGYAIADALAAGDLVAAPAIEGGHNAYRLQAYGRKFRLRAERIAA